MGGCQQIGLDRRQDGRSVPLEDPGDSGSRLARPRRANESYRTSVATTAVTRRSQPDRRCRSMSGRTLGGDQSPAEPRDHEPSRNGRRDQKRLQIATSREARTTVDAQRTPPRSSHLRPAQPPHDQRHNEADRDHSQTGAKPVERGRREATCVGLGPSFRRLRQVCRKSGRSVSSRSEGNPAATDEDQRQRSTRPHRAHQSEPDAGADDDEQLEATQAFAFHTHVGR